MVKKPLFDLTLRESIGRSRPQAAHHPVRQCSSTPLPRARGTRGPRRVRVR